MTPIKKIFIVLIVISCAFHSSEGQSSKTEKEIIEVLDVFINAHNEFDGAKINSMTVKDSFYLWLNDGRIITQDDINKITPAAKQNNKPEFKYELIEKDIKILNHKSAVAIFTLKNAWHEKNSNEVVTTSIYTIVFEKQKGNWLIATIHSSALKEDRNF